MRYWSFSHAATPPGGPRVVQVIVMVAELEGTSFSAVELEIAVGVVIGVIASSPTAV